MHADQTYWGKPVPSFGDPLAKILIVGLAPAAHGANRTGRMFTGDRSGQFLYRALHKAGLSNQSTYEHSDDGLVLRHTWITNAVHCAPPQNKPTKEEKNNCFDYFVQELRLLKHVKVIIALGNIAWDIVFDAMKTLKHTDGGRVKFSHGSQYQSGPYFILGSYHPSQQNTFTGRLTENMFDDVFVCAQNILA